MRRLDLLDDETWDLYAIKPDGSGARRITKVADGQRLLGSGSIIGVSR
jgi:hypothetical protein